MDNNLKTTQSGIARSRLLKLLLITMVALVVADGIISMFLVAQGLGHEGNPLLRAWIRNDAFLGIKLAGGLLAAFLLWNISKRYPRLSFAVTICAVMFYTVLVFWSIFIFLFAGV